MIHLHSTAIDPTPIDTRIRRLESALADFSAQDDPDTGDDTSPEAA